MLLYLLFYCRESGCCCLYAVNKRVVVWCASWHKKSGSILVSFSSLEPLVWFIPWSIVLRHASRVQGQKVLVLCPEETAAGLLWRLCRNCGSFEKDHVTKSKNTRSKTKHVTTIETLFDNQSKWNKSKGYVLCWYIRWCCTYRKHDSALLYIDFRFPVSIKTLSFLSLTTIPLPCYCAVEEPVSEQITTNNHPFAT